MSQPEITIVVCTYNRSAMLSEALRSLYDLYTGSEFAYEVLVVDNNSADDTPAAIERAAGESRATLRGVRETKPGVAAARNRGVREAQGQWIAFFDDDQIADCHWLWELRAGARAHNARLVGGAVHLALPQGCTRELDPTCRMLLGESRWSELPQPYNGKTNPGAGNLMLERAIFDEVGLFNEALRRGEDTDLYRRTRRAGIEAWYLPKAIIHHMTPDERLTDAYLLKLSRNMGEMLGDHDWNTKSSLNAAIYWLAKGARSAGFYWPRWQLARLRGSSEAAIGRRCQVAISSGHFAAGWRRLVARLRAPKVPVAAPVTSRPIE